MLKKILSILFIFQSTLIFAQIIEEEDDLNLNDTKEATIEETVDKPANNTNNLQVPQPLNISGGTIKIICNKENARVTINNMELGTTPFCRSGFQPGFYNIELHHEQCHPFSKMVLLEKNDTLQIDAQLVPAGERFTPAPEYNITVAPSANATPQSVLSEKTVPVATTPLKSERGTMIITCNVPEVTVWVNKVNIGKTPITKNGLPGYYEVEVKCCGYKPFFKMVQLKGNDTVFVQADLTSELSRLIVTSIPSNANVVVNSKLVGVTPFDSSQIAPSTYNVHIELPDYVTVKKLVTLTASTTDTVSVVLKTVAFRDSVKKVRAHQFKIFRRTFFGICTAGSVGGLIAFNYKTGESLDTEKKAHEHYMEPGLSGYEYDVRYQNYQDAVTKTDKNIKSRRAFTVLSAIAAAGLTISIPF
ncbi:MAG TPA: PEGA domain-containing protein [Chitinispirillaceae bacterium]|nr:PEGA domain-containing protein [Chitinispirillaceae bacterium]